MISALTVLRYSLFRNASIWGLDRAGAGADGAGADGAGAWAGIELMDGALVLSVGLGLPSALDGLGGLP